MPRNSADTSFGGQFFRSDFIAHGLNGTGRRADKGHTLFIKCFGEGLVFAQKSITRMHSFSTGLANGVDNFVDNEIAFAGRRTANMHCLVSVLNVLGARIGIGINSDRFNAHLAGGTNNAAGDFPAIGNEYFFKHAANL